MWEVVSCLETLNWPYYINWHFAGDYSRDYISSSDNEVLVSNPHAASRIFTGAAPVKIKTEPGAPVIDVDAEFDEMDSTTDYSAVFAAMDMHSKKGPPTAALPPPPSPTSAADSHLSEEDDGTDDEPQAAAAAAPAPAPGVKLSHRLIREARRGGVLSGSLRVSPGARIAP